MTSSVSIVWITVSGSRGLLSTHGMFLVEADVSWVDHDVLNLRKTVGSWSQRRGIWNSAAEPALTRIVCTYMAFCMKVSFFYFQLD